MTAMPENVPIPSPTAPVSDRSGVPARPVWVGRDDPRESVGTAPAGPSRDELVARYAHLVKYVVGRLGVAVGGVSDHEDAMQVGTIGLLKAIDGYDARHAASFESYAITRIRGTILDSIRSLDTVGRTGREAGRAIQAAIGELTGQLGRMPDEAEVAERLGVSVARYREQLQVASLVILSLNELRLHDDDEGVGLEDLTADSLAVDPEAAAVQNDLVASLGKEIRRLDERQQLILSLYYRDGLTFREIGEVLRITESRVCQIHAELVLALRARLAEPDVAQRLNRRRSRR